MFHLYFLLSLSVESAKFCKSCTVPALFKVHQKVLNALSKVLGLTWVQWQFCCYEIKCNSVKSFRCGSKGRSQFKLSARLHASLHFRKSLFKSVVWILLLHFECVYVYINFFMLCHVILGCQVVSPVAVTHCEKSLSSHGDPKPERKGDLAASEVWIFLVQMFSKKCEIGNAWKIGKRLKQMHVLSCCVVFYMDMAR